MPHDALNKIDAARLWDALRDGLESLPAALDRCRDEDRPEELYWIITRQMEVLRVLWAIASPATLPHKEKNR